MNYSKLLYFLFIAIVCFLSTFSLFCNDNKEDMPNIERNDNNESDSLSCVKMCNKKKECNENMTDKEVEECLSQCDAVKSSKYYQTKFLSAIDDCYDKTCSEINSCVDKSKDICVKADYSPYINAYCDKTINCGTQWIKEECIPVIQAETDEKIKQGKINICLTDKFYLDIVDCVKSANCSTLSKDIDNCFKKAP